MNGVWLSTEQWANKCNDEYSLEIEHKYTHTHIVIVTHAPNKTVTSLPINQTTAQLEPYGFMLKVCTIFDVGIYVDLAVVCAQTHSLQNVYPLYASRNQRMPSNHHIYRNFIRVYSFERTTHFHHHQQQQNILFPCKRKRKPGKEKLVAFFSSKLIKSRCFFLSSSQK